MKSKKRTTTLVKHPDKADFGLGGEMVQGVCKQLTQGQMAWHVKSSAWERRSEDIDFCSDLSVCCVFSPVSQRSHQSCQSIISCPYLAESG